MRFFTLVFFILITSGCAKYSDYTESIQTINTAEQYRIKAIGAGITAITSAAVDKTTGAVEARPIGVMDAPGSDDGDGGTVKLYAPVDRGVEWMARREIARDMAMTFIKAVNSRPAGPAAPNDPGTVVKAIAKYAVPLAGIWGATAVMSEGVKNAGETTTYSGQATEGGSVGGSGQKLTSIETTTEVSEISGE